MKDKTITIAGKDFYVILDCTRKGHTLCVAAKPWGESAWGEGCNGQKILDVADNRNPGSLTYEWFNSLPRKIKEGMLTVSAATNDVNKHGQGQLEQTEMFIPSDKEWKVVPKKIRKLISAGVNVWSRSLAGYSSSNYCYAWHIFSGNVVCSNDVSYTYAVAPAFYMEDSVLHLLFKEQGLTRTDNSFELATRIVDCISDGYDDEENRDEAVTGLYNELSQLPADSDIKAAFVSLCERVEELETEVD